MSFEAHLNSRVNVAQEPVGRGPCWNFDWLRMQLLDLSDLVFVRRRTDHSDENSNSSQSANPCGDVSTVDKLIIAWNRSIHGRTNKPTNEKLGTRGHRCQNVGVGKVVMAQRMAQCIHSIRQTLFTGLLRRRGGHGMPSLQSKEGVTR